MKTKNIKSIIYILLISIPSVLFAQPDDYIGYWTFDGDSLDHSTGNNSVIPRNGALRTADRFGNNDSAYSFDGYDDYLELATPYTFDSTQAWTVSMWIDWAGPSTEDFSTALFGEMTYVPNLVYGNSFFLKYNDSKRFVFRDSTNTNNYFSIGTSDSLYQTGWRHLTVRADGTGNLSVYIDGIHKETIQANTTFKINSIGRGYIEPRYGFNGSIDEVRLYNRALNTAEINQLYTAEPTPPAPTLEIKKQPTDTTVCLQSLLALETIVDEGINWQDPNIWRFSGGGVTWDSTRQAWKCVGHSLIYLKPEYWTLIDPNDSYTISVDVYNQSSSGRLYWGGTIHDQNNIYIRTDYAATQGFQYPTQGTTTTYQITGKTGSAATYTGWGSSEKLYYRTFGYVNYLEGDTAVSYISNIKVENTTRNYNYFGSQDITYQWYKNAQVLSNETYNNIYIGSIESSDAGSYYCQVSDGTTTIQSREAVLSIKNSPVITQELTGGTYCTGENATLSTQATGQGITGYTWYKDGTQIQTGPTANQHNIPSYSQADQGNYTVEISTAECTVKTFAHQSLNKQPELTGNNQPTDTIVYVNDSIVLSTNVQQKLNWKDPNIWKPHARMSWDEGKQAWKAVGYGIHYLNAQSAIEIDTTHIYKLEVDMYNESGRSNFYWGGTRLDINDVRIPGYGGTWDYSCTRGGPIPPRGWNHYENIKTGNASGYDGWGTEATHSYAVGGLVNYMGTTEEVSYITGMRFYDSTAGVEYFGEETLTYQWYKNGQPIAGETGDKLTVNILSETDKGDYHCVITNTCGSTTTATTTVNVLPEGLVGSWDLNHTGNNIAPDNTGLGNDGIVNGTTPARDRYNQADGAMSFDGVDDYIKFDSVYVFDSTDAWTVSMWLDWKGYSANTSLTLLFGNESTGDGFAIRAGGNNNFMHRNVNGTFNYFQLESSSELYNNGWKHLTVSSDGNGNISAYIDGNHIQTITANTSIYVNAFGRAYPTNDYCYKGSLDDIHIYNRALSAEEVTLLYNSEKTSDIISVPYVQSSVNPVHGTAPTLTENYVHTITPREAYNNMPAGGNYSAVEQVQYFDGLGRPTQAVSIQASPSGADIIQPVEYDEFGREVIKYLPYTKAGNNGQFVDPTVALTEQANFYNPSQTGVNHATDLAPFAETIFENSPLNRVFEQSAPGTAWQVIKDINGKSTEEGKTVKTYYATNTANSVKLWKAGNSLTNIYQNGYYAAGELYVTEIHDENYDGGNNGGVSFEYKNKQGQVILKETRLVDDALVETWLQTYYVYNDFGLLRCVIPPKAAARTTGIIDEELCYFYTYDHRKRMTHKKLPGAETVYMVYDKRDRLVATQDGNMRTAGKWMVTKYDYLNRPVITAEYSADSTGLLSRLALDASDLSEELIGATNTNMHGYTNSSFPSNLQTNDVLSVTYYDDYAAVEGMPQYNDLLPLGNQLDDTIYSFVPEITGNTKSLTTATKIKVLGSVNDYDITVSYYDEKARPVQIVADNYLGAIDRISTHYNFVGEVLATITEHTNGTDTIVMGDRVVYDHAGRMLENWQQIAGNEEILLAASKYNELGELTEKYTHGTKQADGSINTIQKTDYAYNIRGWMTSINNPGNLLPATENDLFAMNLHYNDASSLTGLTTSPQFNGNISAIDWVDAHTNQQKAYTFVYDGINRLTSAQYATNTTAWNAIPDFSVAGISYDENGNIQSLQRNDNTGAGLDNLAYTYYNNGNRLQAVADASGNNLGFDDGNTVGDDYTYDANGNMVTDLNKGITSNISYNYLNLPQSITHNLGTTNYVYNAGGVKLSHDDGTTITEYIGNFVYENGSLRYILTGEGKIEHNAGTFAYQYFHKDHLGNTRVTYKQNGEIVQTADYYPFGLRHEPMALEDANQKYLYNGKELQPELGWLDYGARFYDPSIARWNVLDPKAEAAYDWTPFRYAYNNPLKFIDPDGQLEDWYENEEGNIVYDEEVKSQEDLDAKGVEGEYIADEFIGEDQDGKLFHFGADGTVEESEATKPLLDAAGINTDDIVSVESTMIDDGENNVATASFSIAGLLLLDDATVIGVLDDPIIVPCLIVGGIASIWATSPTYEFAAEHKSNKQRKNWNKHTNPRSGRKNTKNRQKPDWKPNPNKKK